MATYTSKYTGVQIDSNLDSVDTLKSDVVLLKTTTNANSSDIVTLQTILNNLIIDGGHV